jgi:hypothetical protein
VVIWGAGAKAVAFLNMLNIQSDQIEYVVDINAKKHGAYIPGTAQKIMAPEFLSQYHPDAIIVMNPEYLSEIRSVIKGMGISAKLSVVSTATGGLYEGEAL